MLRTLIAGLLAGSLGAQNTLYVHPTSPYPTVDAALAAAAPGDTIVIQRLQIPPFACNIGVTLKSAFVTFVTTAYPGAQLPAATFDIPPGQELHCSDLFFRCDLEVVGGRATFATGDLLYGANVGAPVLSVQSAAAVHLQNFRVVAGANPPVVRGDLTVTGASIENAAFNSTGTAIEVDGGRLEAASTRLRNNLQSGAGSAVMLRNGARAWLADCEVGVGPTACAFDVDPQSTLRTHRCTVVEASAGCAAAQAGPLLAASTATLLELGNVFTVDYTFDPQSFVAVFASPALDTVAWGPVLEQPTWLDHGRSFAAATLLTDAAGLASASFTIPANPLLQHRRIWFVGVGGPGLPLQASVPVGGVVR